DLDWHAFEYMRKLPFKEMLAVLRDESLGINMPPGRVPHTIFYGFLESEIVGRISVRHALNDYLLKRGGHIGYAVAKRFRRRGFATEMVRHALEFCKTIGLKSVLITCADDNIPSWKIIERFGGKLENKIWDDEDQETLRRYWIELE